MIKTIKTKIPFELSDYVLKNEFQKIADSQGWLNSEKSIILAVSGGGDSTALAYFFHKYFYGKFIIVHVNHLLRGDDAFRDQKFVENLAEKFQVECVTLTVDVKKNILRGD